MDAARERIHMELPLLFGRIYPFQRIYAFVLFLGPWNEEDEGWLVFFFGFFLLFDTIELFIGEGGVQGEFYGVA